MTTDQDIDQESNANKTNKENIETKINRETARIQWKELAPHFAAGNLITISNELDLIHVAKAMADNDTDQVKAWMSNGDIYNTTDNEALKWHAQNVELWAVVIKPWVLVQLPHSNNIENFE